MAKKRRPTSSPSGRAAKPPADLGQRLLDANRDLASRPLPARGTSPLWQPPPQPTPLGPSPMGPSAALPGPSPSDPAEAARRMSPPIGLLGLELGRTGLAQYWGRIAEEFLPELSYERGRRVFREMRDNDATVGALVAAIKLMIRSVTWRVESDTTGDERADFLASCMDDMDHTWNDLIAEVVDGTLTFGWSLHELVYKIRTADESQYTDGLVGWKKMPLRSQESLWRWDFDEDTQVLRGMFQRPPPDFIERYIPLEKALLFRLESLKSNPEGRSVLRNGYRAWYFKKYLEQIEAIGVERDLAGLPVIKAPYQLFLNDPSNILPTLKKIATNIRVDEQAGIVLPQAFDPDTKQPLYDIKLLASEGRKQFDTSQIITRWDSRLLVTVLVDFLIMGHDQIGSFAMSKNKIDFFNMALGAWMDALAATFNRYAIPRLLQLNGLEEEDPPYFVHGTVERRDLQYLGEYLQKLALSGMPIFPNPKIENALLEFADLPTMTPEEVADRQVEDEHQAARDAAAEQRGVPTAPNEPGNPPPGSVPQGSAGSDRPGRPAQPAPTQAQPQAPATTAKGDEMHTHIHLPESMLKVGPPVVNVAAPQIEVAAPEVHVTNEITTPRPDVRVVNRIPSAPAPTVHVDARPDASLIEKQMTFFDRLVERLTRKRALKVERVAGKITKIEEDE